MCTYAKITPVFMSEFLRVLALIKYYFALENVFLVRKSKTTVLQRTVFVIQGDINGGAKAFLFHCICLFVYSWIIKNKV